MQDKPLFDIVFTFLKTKENEGATIDIKEIKEAVNLLSSVYPNANKQKVINQLQTHFTISIGVSETLYNHKTPWILNYKQNHPNLEDFPFWNNYKRHLLESVKLPQQVVDEIDNSTDAILEGMGNPNDSISFEKKGLVIGYVQSGKTGNYVGLINKAIDVGYRFIVVLAGMHNNLRQQTQFRIDQGVNGTQKINGEIKRVGVGLLPNKFKTDTQSLTTSDVNGDFNAAATNMNGINFNIDAPLIAVVKKNIHPLNNINNWLQYVIGINMEEQSDKAVLIIDDESDQASINNNFTKDNLNDPIIGDNGVIESDNTPSKINGLIVQLLQKFSRRVYAGYTATPYANVLIPLDNKNYSDIFPEDFIVRLDQPSNYLGPEKYFGFSDDDRGLPGIIEIDSDENFIGHLKDAVAKAVEDTNTKEEARKAINISISNSLKTATLSFVLSGGIRFFRGQNNSHMSMLIHVSHLTSIQDGLGKEFKKFWNKLKGELLNNIDSTWSALECIYNGDYRTGLRIDIESQNNTTEVFSNHESFTNSNFEIPNSFQDLKDNIRSFIVSVEILIINTTPDNKEDRLDYHLYDKGRKVIAIGGNTMSRGLTLEGLHTSYFIRHARAFDTLMQMGRWFGYRPDYADVCKVFTSTDIAIDFNEICLADTIMNDNITAMIDSNASPRDFLIKIKKSSTSIAVTSKMGVSREMQVSWAGGETISNLIQRKSEVIKNNHNILIETLSSISDYQNQYNQENKVIFNNVPIVKLTEFKSKYKLVNNNGSLDIHKIFEFYLKSGFDSIDIVVLGRQASNRSVTDVNFSYLGNEIGLAQRNSKKDFLDNPNHFKVPNGKLTDANYLYSFIDEELDSEKQKSPSVVCNYLKRPIITFVALNPYYFYSKETVNKDNPLDLNNLHDNINGVKNHIGFDAIPYGVSFATPSKKANSNKLNDISVSVLVNEMVYDRNESTHE